MSVPCWAYLSATETAQLIAAGEVTSAEIVGEELEILKCGVTPAITDVSVVYCLC